MVDVIGYIGSETPIVNRVLKKNTFIVYLLIFKTKRNIRESRVVVRKLEFKHFNQLHIQNFDKFSYVFLLLRNK